MENNILKLASNLKEVSGNTIDYLVNEITRLELEVERIKTISISEVRIRAISDAARFGYGADHPAIEECVESFKNANNF